MRLPVTLIFGLSRLAKRELVEHWRTSSQGRLALIVDQGEDVKLPRAGDERSADASVELLAGCACCTGRAGLMSALNRLARRGPWSHLLIELNAAAHPAEFIDLMRSQAFSGQIELRGAIAVVETQHAHATLPSRMREWVTEHLEAADRVVLRSGVALTTAARLEYEAALAQWSIFRPAFEAWGPHVALPPLVVAQRLALGEASASLIAQAGLAPHWRWVWRADPSRVLDRTRAQTALQHFAKQSGQPFRAVIRTEREWYGWRDRCWETTFWRRESRIEVDFDAAQRSRLAGLLEQLANQLSGG